MRFKIFFSKIAQIVIYSALKEQKIWSRIGGHLWANNMAGGKGGDVMGESR